MSRDESPMPGPRATFPQVGQPSAKGKEQAADEQPTSNAERHFDKTWLKRAMERMEHRLQVMICSSLDPVSRGVNDLEVHVTAIEEQVASHEEYKQEDDSPLDSGQWRDSPAEPYPAMGRESRTNPLQGGPTPTKDYMGTRSTCFEQTDVDPPGDNDRQEPIILDNSHSVEVDNNSPELANNLWKMHIEALFTSLDEASGRSTPSQQKGRKF